MLVDNDFHIEEYYLKEHDFPIDNTFWVELKDANMPLIYIPDKRARRGWPERLREEYGIEENVYYDPEIVGLPLTLTKEQIEEVKRKMNKIVIKNLKDPTPLNPPKSISPDQALDLIKLKILAKRSASELLTLLDGKETNLHISLEESLTDWEKKVLLWNKTYGFLVPYNEMKGVLFPTPRNDNSLKYEVVREYFFNIKYFLNFPDRFFSGIILSVAQEPNTDRAIFGFRRDFKTDWVFGDEGFFDGETVIIRGIYANGKVEGGIKLSVKPFIEEMSYLIRNLEAIISS